MAKVKHTHTEPLGQVAANWIAVEKGGALVSTSCADRVQGWKPKRVAPDASRMIRSSFSRFSPGIQCGRLRTIITRPEFRTLLRSYTRIACTFLNLCRHQNTDLTERCTWPSCAVERERMKRTSALSPVNSHPGKPATVSLIQVLNPSPGGNTEWGLQLPGSWNNDTERWDDRGHCGDPE
jgi:hypothetical protein